MLKSTELWKSINALNVETKELLEQEAAPKHPRKKKSKNSKKTKTNKPINKKAEL